MRAILIDPEDTSITEIDIKGDGLKEIYSLIGCESVTEGSKPLRGSLSAGFDGLLVSDDMLDERDDPRFWFQVDADKDPPSSFPIAGRGLVTGVDKTGETCDAVISIADLTPRITFTKRKFRGFRTIEFPGGMGVEIDAPVFDDHS